MTIGELAGILTDKNLRIRVLERIRHRDGTHRWHVEVGSEEGFVLVTDPDLEVAVTSAIASATKIREAAVPSFEVRRQLVTVADGPPEWAEEPTA